MKTMEEKPWRIRMKMMEIILRTNLKLDKTLFVVMARMIMKGRDRMTDQETTAIVQ